MLEDLKEYLHREPFAAFRIILTTGGSYEVTSPYQVAIGQTMLFYCYPHSDRKAFLRMNQIAAFEDSERTSS